ncbi:hypothetical protein SKAU_G00123240 [Synaphobranchus kaupii]|uniref:Uncharacterized protein n=1 Tax=Synaphobranchus kaupii TaxID=118154 RepID=A0A9Q1FP55_SYNKA|nr:hypothetical protein SKAU_G00123240 [Synaphobranchus kaupii]
MCLTKGVAECLRLGDGAVGSGESRLSVYNARHPGDLLTKADGGCRCAPDIQPLLEEHCGRDSNAGQPPDTKVITHSRTFPHSPTHKGTSPYLHAVISRAVIQLSQMAEGLERSRKELGLFSSKRVTKGAADAVEMRGLGPDREQPHTQPRLRPAKRQSENSFADTIGKAVWSASRSGHGTLSDSGCKITPARRGTGHGLSPSSHFPNYPHRSGDQGAEGKST